jgi:hypothetical protein
MLGIGASSLNRVAGWTGWETHSHQTYQNVTPALESLLVTSQLVGLLAFSSGPFSLGITLRRPRRGRVTPALESLLVASQLVGLLASSSGPFSLGNTLRRPLLARPGASLGEVSSECFRARRAPSPRQVVLRVVIRLVVYFSRTGVTRPRRGLLRVIPSSSGPFSSEGASALCCDSSAIFLARVLF